ncbi:uncharacterized protein (DUF305 family) [Georgenia muralis]|uniref:Uncharacterized protein (DUF305 family) n=1 Tax=Georgenia muralis TaxID=154117 RepID=A0A3N4Z6Q4_9MICO|nr:uncharacterized protein (DUF305 family) [Georgenia muralis]
MTAWAALLLVALAAVVGLIAGSRLGTGAAVPSTGSVDAGFARDMGAHHSQAVQMSVLVRDRTEDPEVRALALDIILTQQQQAGQMFGWLELWGLPQSSQKPPMAWMQDNHANMSEPDEGTTAAMPGMASQDDLNKLATASGRDAERLYLQLMIPHHQGGVEMAQYAANEATEEVVSDLAVTIVNAQTAELAVLNNLLNARGGPLPE